MITKLQAAHTLAAVSWMVAQSGAATVGAAGVHAASVDAARPPPECQAHAGFDRDLTLPGYLLHNRVLRAALVSVAAAPDEDA